MAREPGLPGNLGNLGNLGWWLGEKIGCPEKVSQLTTGSLRWQCHIPCLKKCGQFQQVTTPRTTAGWWMKGAPRPCYSKRMAEASFQAIGPFLTRRQPVAG